MVGTLEEIRANKHWRDSFPAETLEGCKSGLLLFCARERGAYDGVRVLEAGIGDVTAVDAHGPYLRAMKMLYPPAWTFVEEDAWVFAEAADRTWDFVSVDPPTGLAERVVEDIDVWARLAKRWLIVGTHTMAIAPEGFETAALHRRSEHEDGWYWLVLRRRPDSW